MTTKKNVIALIAPFVRRREALAEALLVSALADPKKLRAFTALAFPKREDVTFVAPQVVTDDRSARHDLVFATKDSKRLFVELKVDAPLTKRQRKALELGTRRASESIRIDVLISRNGDADLEALAIHRAVKCLTWQQLEENKIVPDGIPSYRDLWIGHSVFRTTEIRHAAHAYAAYRAKERQTASWLPLWSALQYLREELQGTLVFRRLSGSRTNRMYYESPVHLPGRPKQHGYIGWCFTAHGSGQRVGLYLQNGNALLRDPKPLDAAWWNWNDDERGTLLWSSDEDSVDMRRIATKIRALQFAH